VVFGVLEPFASWLVIECRILCGELWPDRGADPEALGLSLIKVRKSPWTPRSVARVSRQNAFT
jgi:hypothetical protein